MKRYRTFLMALLLVFFVGGCTVIVNNEVRNWVLDKTSMKGYEPLLMTIANYEIYEFTVRQLLRSFFVVAIAFFMRKAIVDSLFTLLIRVTNSKKSRIIHRILKNLHKPIAHFVIVLGLFFAMESLPLDKEVSTVVWRLFKAISILLFIWSLIRVSDVFLDGFVRRRHAENTAVIGLLPFLSSCLKIFLFVMGLIMVLENLGYSTGSIVAAFGIGSAAIAFASQDTIANFFGSISIVLDHPFKVGDRIRLGQGIDGFVEKIGIRSTTIRTLPKSALTIPNRVLANEKIDNWTRLQKRQIVQDIGVTYDTSPEKIQLIVDDILALLKADPDVDQDYMVVNFFEFGESSLDIRVMYYTTTIVYLEFMAIKQRVNLEIMKIVEKHGSSVAFPTRTLHLAKDPGLDTSGGKAL